MDSESSRVEEVDDSDVASPTSAYFHSSPPQLTVGELHNEVQSPALGSGAERDIAFVAGQPFAQGENAATYFSRPNRYFGPASTWKSWTEEERTIAQSLDRARSQDLGVHLINAFALKKKSSASRSKGRWKQLKKGKERAASVLSSAREDQEDDHPRHEDAFSLPKYWTAWPMPPDVVPREELLSETGTQHAIRSESDLWPSASLEDCIVAAATKQARETWSARRWEDNSDTVHETDTKADHGLSDADDEEVRHDNPHGIDQEDEADSMAEDPDYPVFSSRPLSSSQSADPEQKAEVKAGSENGSVNFEPKPVPLADEDKARQVFLPSARHIMSKVDDLLLGLHRARYAYASKPLGKRRGRYSHTPEEQPDPDDRERNTSLPPNHRSRRSASVDTQTSELSSASVRASREPRRAQNLELRDWSDVVGMASLTGWDPAVVARASERCAELFGENMLFRTFHEGAPTDSHESYFTEHLAFDTEGSEEPTETNQEHLPNCPHESCPRHTVPFRKTYRLQRHLAEVHHPNRMARQQSIPRLVQSRSTSLDVSDVELGRRTPPDFIVCPVNGCRRSKKPFSTGRRLYDHVRRMHPGVDVRKVKRLEASRRGERRGRPTNERRRRSASQGRSNDRTEASSPLGQMHDDHDDDYEDEDE